MAVQDGLGKSCLSYLSGTANKNHFFLKIFKDVRCDISHMTILTLTPK